MKENGDIETIFSRFQVLVFGLQVLSKSYITSDHVKKILGSLFVRYRPKVTAIQEAKDLNIISFESLIRNIEIHEMKLNRDETAKKSNSLTLKSVS